MLVNNETVLYCTVLYCTGSALDAAERATIILEDAGETNAG